MFTKRDFSGLVTRKHNGMKARAIAIRGSAGRNRNRNSRATTAIPSL
ncbi:hypothetical protein [Scytonema sp. HK-05]|nr:hypothetical protein [Scytonema sp. HK-05]